MNNEKKTNWKTMNNKQWKENQLYKKMHKRLRHYFKEDIRMAITHLKGGSTSAVVKKMQAIGTRWYYHTPTGGAKIKMTDNTKYWQK